MTLRLEWADDLEQLRVEWEVLAERSGNVFATWEWAVAWRRHFGTGRSAVALCRDECGAPAAIVPLYMRRRGPLTVARFIGHGPADELGPVCGRGDSRGGDALALSCEAAEGWDVLLAERLPVNRPWAGPVSGRTLQRESSPTASIAGFTWDEYLATRSANLRSQIRRKERKLRREHGLAYRLTDEPERLADDLETAFRLHAMRWGTNASGALAGARAEFHRDFAAVALERGWLRLWTAEADGKPVASWYGLRFGGTEGYYQSGRDPRWDRMSVGLVLLAHTMREAIADGMSEYRFLRGGEDYKRRFATDDAVVETVAVGRGAAGRATVATAALAMRLPAPLRRHAVRAVG